MPGSLHLPLTWKSSTWEQEGGFGGSALGAQSPAISSRVLQNNGDTFFNKLTHHPVYALSGLNSTHVFPRGVRGIKGIFFKGFFFFFHNIVNVLSAAESFMLKWLILCYVNFISICTKNHKNKQPPPPYPRGTLLSTELTLNSQPSAQTLHINLISTFSPPVFSVGSPIWDPKWQQPYTPRFLGQSCFL